MIEQVTNVATVITVALSALTAFAATWYGLRKHRADLATKAGELAALQDEKAQTLAREQRELEVRLRQEQIAAYTTQAALEQNYRAEILVHINQVRAEAGRLEKLLHASEDENRLLRRRVLDLELEIARLRHEINGGSRPAGTTGEATITLTAERSDAIVVRTEAEAEKE